MLWSECSLASHIRSHPTPLCMRLPACSSFGDPLLATYVSGMKSINRGTTAVSYDAPNGKCYLFQSSNARKCQLQEFRHHSDRCDTFISALIRQWQGTAEAALEAVTGGAHR
eukprot:5185837-Amphidinium_carterae.1